MLTQLAEAAIDGNTLKQVATLASLAIAYGVGGAIANRWFPPVDRTGDALTKLAEQMQSDRIARQTEHTDDIALRRAEQEHRRSELTDAMKAAVDPLKGEIQHLAASLDKVSDGMAKAIDSAAKNATQIAVQEGNIDRCSSDIAGVDGRVRTLESHAAAVETRCAVRHS